MNVRKFALIGGAVMILFGILSLVPGLNYTILSPDLRLETSYGLFLGFFPMNVLNKLALIGFGIWGVSVAKAMNVQPSIDYSRTVFVVMGLLAILGLFPATRTLGGYWPLYGGEILAHAFFAVLGGYFGWVSVARERREHPVGA